MVCFVGAVRQESLGLNDIEQRLGFSRQSSDGRYRITSLIATAVDNRTASRHPNNRHVCIENGDKTVAADQVSYRGYCVEPSVLDFLRDLDRVIDLDAKVTNGAFNFGMPEQKLHSADVACPPVDQNCLRAAQRVRAELRRIRSDTCDPVLNEARVLSGRQAALVAASGEQELSWFAPGQSNTSEPKV